VGKSVDNNEVVIHSAMNYKKFKKWKWGKNGNTVTKKENASNKMVEAAIVKVEYSNK